MQKYLDLEKVEPNPISRLTPLIWKSFNYIDNFWVLCIQFQIQDIPNPEPTFRIQQPRQSLVPGNCVLQVQVDFLTIWKSKALSFALVPEYPSPALAR